MSIKPGATASPDTSSIRPAGFLGKIAKRRDRVAGHGDVLPPARPAQPVIQRAAA